MRAILRTGFGGPAVLVIREIPDPEPKDGHAVIDVKAFSLNHAELHMRKGEWAEIAEINPLAQMASSVYPTFYASFVFGKPGFPLSDVPLQAIAADVQAGGYKARPARVFRFGEIQEAHRIMESNAAKGKMVVVRD
jgi:NADPH:quinone reductase-like Zn-dependent oxidoreductase